MQTTPDAVLPALFKERAVKPNARLVGHVIVAVGDYSCPGDGHAIEPEPHLGKQADVLQTVVIVADGLVGGVALVGLAGVPHHLATADSHAIRPVGDHAHAGQAAPVRIVDPFAWARWSTTARLSRRRTQRWGEGRH